MAKRKRIAKAEKADKDSDADDNEEDETEKKPKKTQKGGKSKEKDAILDKISKLQAAMGSQKKGKKRAQPDGTDESPSASESDEEQ